MSLFSAGQKQRSKTAVAVLFAVKSRVHLSALGPVRGLWGLGLRGAEPRLGPGGPGGSKPSAGFLIAIGWDH